MDFRHPSDVTLLAMVLRELQQVYIDRSEQQAILALIVREGDRIERLANGLYARNLGVLMKSKAVARQAGTPDLERVAALLDECITRLDMEILTTQSMLRAERSLHDRLAPAPASPPVPMRAKRSAKAAGPALSSRLACDLPDEEKAA